MDTARELINSVNNAELERLRAFSESSDATNSIAAKQFQQLVLGAQSMIVYTYRLTAQRALRQPDPKLSAGIWGEYIELCDVALSTLKKAKERLPNFDTDTLYDLTLDYRNEAFDRQQQDNLATACQNVTPPSHWFASQS